MTAIDFWGEFTIFSVAECRQRILDALDAGLEVEIDLSQVSDIDTAGLQLMLASLKEAAARDQLLRFTGHSQAVLDALSLCRLTETFGNPLPSGPGPDGERQGTL